MCGLDSDSDGFPDVQLNCNEQQCEQVYMHMVYYHKGTHNMIAHTTVTYYCCKGFADISTQSLRNKGLYVCIFSSSCSLCNIFYLGCTELLANMHPLHLFNPYKNKQVGKKVCRSKDLKPL